MGNRWSVTIRSTEFVGACAVRVPLDGTPNRTGPDQIAGLFAPDFSFLRFWDEKLVGETGLEPARLAPRDPKSRVSAISPLAQPFSLDWEFWLGWFPCRMDSRGNVPGTCGRPIGFAPAIEA